MFKLIFLIVLVAATVNAEVDKLRLDQLQEIETDNVNLFLAQHPNVKMDSYLMDMANNEAKRLAQLMRLEPPVKTFLQSNFIGVSFKITGYDKAADSNVFTVICYDNFLNNSSNTLIHSMLDVTCGNPKVDPRQFNKVGYGKALDSNGYAYIVRLIQTTQV